MLFLDLMQFLNFVVFSVIGGYRKTMVCNIERKIASHDPQTDQTNIEYFLHFCVCHVIFLHSDDACCFFSVLP